MKLIGGTTRQKRWAGVLWIVFGVVWIGLGLIDGSTLTLVAFALIGVVLIGCGLMNLGVAHQESKAGPPKGRP
jgi:hypothetical protein